LSGLFLTNLKLIENSIIRTERWDYIY